jgi:SAM-dependent methyltransferase
MTTGTDWAEQTFDQTYLETEGLQFSQQTTNEEVDEIVRLLGLKPGMSVLDLACGHGRHSLELARRGLGPITGLDFSQPAIDLAKSSASAEGLNLHFVLGDMRKLEFEAEFDVVFNVFNSMFYWDDETHLGILEGILRALKPGGCLFLNLYNPYWVVTGIALRAHPAVRLWNLARGVLSRVKRVFQPAQVALGLRSSKTTLFDVSRGVVHGVRRMTEQGGRVRETPYENRLYTLPELHVLLERVGFRIDQVLAEHGKTLGWNTPRVLLVVRKFD